MEVLLEIITVSSMVVAGRILPSLGHNYTQESSLLSAVTEKLVIQVLFQGSVKVAVSKGKSLVAKPEPKTGES
jgi:hypothetical protein